jgi:licheninase
VIAAACVAAGLLGCEATTPGLGTPVVEDFNGETLDLARWTPYDYPDTHPRRSKDLVHVEGGILSLEGSVDADGHEIGAGLGDHLEQNYGRWEVRFRVDAGAGYGAAILLWPAEGYTFPDDGEVDIIEAPKPSREGGFNVVHLGADNAQDGHLFSADFTQWHTAAVDWSPGQLVYSLDGVETWRAPTELVPDKVMRLALQLDECAPSVYGGWIPCRDASSPPTVALQVDWVKVYPYDPATAPTTTTTTATTTTATTTTVTGGGSGP